MWVGPTLAQRRYCRPDVGPTLAQPSLLSGKPHAIKALGRRLSSVRANTWSNFLARSLAGYIKLNTRCTGVGKRHRALVFIVGVFAGALWCYSSLRKECIRGTKTSTLKPLTISRKWKIMRHSRRRRWVNSAPSVTHLLKLSFGILSLVPCQQRVHQTPTTMA